MDSKKTAACFAGTLAGLTLARSFYEVHCITAAKYNIVSEKLPPDTDLKIAFLSDLHGRTYGKNNRRLLDLVKKEEPDLILIGGDMLTASKEEADKEVFRLLGNLKKTAPVYYAMGNHEEYLKAEAEDYPGRYKRLKKVLKYYKIPLLNNSHVDLKGNISLYGLEIPEKYYRKFMRKDLKKTQLSSLLGEPDLDRFNILLAHSPAFFESYALWKPDLVLSGHYHGGLVRFPRLGGLISPDLKLFPKYCVGRYQKDQTDLIVSAGCGSHGVNIRLFNKPEVVVIGLSSKTVRI